MEALLKNFDKKDLENSYFQTTGKVKVQWNNLPVGAKVLLHYRNGVYVAVKRLTEPEKSERNLAYDFEVSYVNKIVITDTGEATFEDLSDNGEINIVKYEKVKEII